MRNYSVETTFCGGFYFLRFFRYTLRIIHTPRKLLEHAIWSLGEYPCMQKEGFGLRLACPSGPDHRGHPHFCNSMMFPSGSRA